MLCPMSYVRCDGCSVVSEADGRRVVDVDGVQFRLRTGLSQFSHLPFYVGSGLFLSCLLVRYGTVRS